MPKSIKTEQKTPYARLLDSWLDESDIPAKDVAKKVGVTPPTLSRLRHARVRPASKDTNRRLAEALGKEDELHTLELYAQVARVEDDLRRRLALLVDHIDDRLMMLQEELPDEMLEASTSSDEEDTVGKRLRDIRSVVSVLTRYFPVDEFREGYHRAWRTASTFEIPDSASVQEEDEEETLERAMNRVASITGVSIRSLRTAVKALEIAAEGD